MKTVDFDLVSAWVSAKTGCTIPRIGTALGWIDSDGNLTAGVMYEDFTGPCITATIAIDHGSVVVKSFLQVIFDYPFRQLGCRKILAVVAQTNATSRKMVERMGFEKEAVIFDVFPDGAMIIYSVTPSRCRYFDQEKEHGKKDKDCTYA